MPPTSVWTDNDKTLLDWAIPFYWRHSGSEPKVLDATFGRGVMWRNSIIPHIGMDANTAASVYGDNTRMPFVAEAFDVIIYDPPHMEDVGNYVTYMQYGSNSNQYPAFATEAQRVLRRDGIVLAKIADQVHSGKAQWQHVDLMKAAIGAGLVCCDLIVKVRAAPRIDPKWIHVWHARKRHSYWLVFRKGDC